MVAHFRMSGMKNEIRSEIRYTKIYIVCFDVISRHLGTIYDSAVVKRVPCRRIYDRMSPARQ